MKKNYQGHFLGLLVLLALVVPLVALATVTCGSNVSQTNIFKDGELYSSVTVNGSSSKMVELTGKRETKVYKVGTIEHLGLDAPANLKVKRADGVKEPGMIEVTADSALLDYVNVAHDAHTNHVNIDMKPVSWQGDYRDRIDVDCWVRDTLNSVALSGVGSMEVVPDVFKERVEKSYGVKNFPVLVL